VRVHDVGPEGGDRVVHLLAACRVVQPQQGRARRIRRTLDGIVREQEAPDVVARLFEESSLGVEHRVLAAGKR